MDDGYGIISILSHIMLAIDMVSTGLSGSVSEDVNGGFCKLRMEAISPHDN